MGTSLGLIFHVRVPHAILDLVIASQCKMGLISIINAKVFCDFMNLVITLLRLPEDARLILFQLAVLPCIIWVLVAIIVVWRHLFPLLPELTKTIPV